MLSVGSVMTGIGGIDAGLEACGLTIAWQCEKDPFRREILRHRWPGVLCFDDAKDLEPPCVDLVAAGSPCPGFAAHGSRLGLDDERSGLWRYFVRIIERCQASIVFFENVANILRSRGGQDFASVLEALATLGFDATWGVLRACDAGLPHRRRRLFLLAYTSEGRRALKRQAYDDDGRLPFRHDSHGCNAALPPPPGPRDVAALQAWLAHHNGPPPGIRRDLARFPHRVGQIAAFGDTAPPGLVTLAFRTLRDLVLTPEPSPVVSLFGR